ncbi:MAG: hypothetical protein IID41_01795 [Planctomycetes bacterium]|nr:hypothetical protein [Planctomycetota bacterium]
MKPELEIILTSTVRFTGGQFSYDRKLQDAEVTKWGEERIVRDSKVQYQVSPLPSIVVRLLVAILRQPTYPKTCEFKSAYVLLHNNEEHFAFDRLTSAGKPIIPASYGSTTIDTGIAKEVDGL